MADVSHELGSLRFVVDSPLSSKVAMFNNQADQVQQSQLLNPFSSSNNGRVSPKPTFSKGEYGKPLAGSLTEMRGQKANMHVMREMLELCQIINSEGYKVNDEPSMRVIPFGELFNIYNYISDKVVGILLRARKYKYVQFEGEMLFQRRDDDVPVFLLRPILDIRQEIESKIEMLKRSTSPAPMATTLLLDKGAHEQKLQEAALNVPGGSGSRSPSKSRTPSPATKKSAKSTTEAPAAAAPATEATTATATENANLEAEKVAKTVAMPTNDEKSATTEVAPTSESSFNVENVDQVASGPSKTDHNNNNKNDNNISSTGSDINITINELPTIVIDATAMVGENDKDSPAIEVESTLENVAAHAAETSPANPSPPEATQ